MTLPAGENATRFEVTFRNYDALSNNNNNDLAAESFEVFQNNKNAMLTIVNTLNKEVLNFEIQDKQQKSLGKVTGFNSNGTQDLLVISKDDYSYEVPFVDDFIVEILFDKSIVVMDFPLDLMDINRVV